MSRSGLLSLLCLSVLLLLLAPLTHAGGDVKVDESRTRILIQTESVEVQLAVENSSGETLNATGQLEHILAIDGSRHPNDANLAPALKRAVEYLDVRAAEIDEPFDLNVVPFT